MNILITGGTGFIGSHLVELLLTQGHSLTVLSTASIMHPNLQTVADRIIWKWGSFGDKKLMEEILQGVDTVLHLAWTTVPKNASDNPAYDLETNVVGGLNLLEACVKNKVRRFLFVSTGGALYGLPKYSPLDEKHPLEPISAYGISKVTFERYLHFYRINYGLQYQVFRVSNAYGERQNLNKNQGVIGVWLNHIKNKQPIQIYGDGSVVRDYIYVSDIAAALSKGLSYEGNYTAFNLGYGAGYSLNQILQQIEKTVGIRPEVVFLPARSFDVPVNVLDTNLIKTEFNWAPKVDLEEGIGRVWAWMGG